ncbi:uncharacterized protein PRCAT00001425001 [Priceomyces carsonii]|uniref:uncharacterized protein n=1 Tax=Priceomyces carsonii TaxID=28549 RepID=UPI002ED86E37|nr:unnamed protein product [Priceomyces carsonii]
MTHSDACQTGNLYSEGDLGGRISAVFVILLVSALGSFFPLIAKTCPYIRLPAFCFFITKYFGSGVIVATGYIHLLAEAGNSLTNECLGGVFEEYPWAEGIALMGTFAMFYFDIYAHRQIDKKIERKTNQKVLNSHECVSCFEIEESKEEEKEILEVEEKDMSTNNIYLQMLNSFVLEFGIVFHSVFVGLSLAIASESEFKSLYIAIAFHQMFEGLGLGSRFASTDWPESKKLTPWLLSLAYSLVTPIAIGIGIGVRSLYSPGPRMALITTGVFDALCGGVLIYNSLVELLAHDFLYISEFQGKDGSRKVLLGLLSLSLGALAMALIGKWA